MRFRLKLSSLVLLLLFMGGLTDAGPVTYPEGEDGDRMSAINSLFRYSVVQRASASLDRILDLVNVSTALKDLEREIGNYNTEYEELVKETMAKQEGLSSCVRVFFTDESCDSCFQSCPDTSLDCTVKYEEWDVVSETVAVGQGIRLIDRIHKEVNTIYAFIVQLLSQFSPIVTHSDTVKEHMMQKLNLTSAEIVSIFQSLELLDVYEAKKVQLTHSEVKEVRKKVDQLLRSMGSEDSSQILDEQDLVPFVHVPGQPKQSESVWKKVLNVIESAWGKTKHVSSSAWGTTKDVSSSAWDKTKDVSTTAYCSVKGVFFSKCQDSGRSRRSVSAPTCDPTAMLSQIEIKCQDISECARCSDQLSETCSRRDLSQLSQAHIQYLDALDSVRQKLETAMDKSDQRREQLMSETNEVFLHNLWILPLTDVLTKAKESVKLRDIWFDPSDFYQDDGKVFYRNVRARMSDEMAAVFPDLLLALTPVDVHNKTMTAHVAADAFVLKFKELDFVKESVENLMGLIKLNEI